MDTDTGTDPDRQALEADPSGTGSTTPGLGSGTESGEGIPDHCLN